MLEMSLLFFLFIGFIPLALSNKQNKLNLLTLLPYSNTDEIDGRLCQLAMQVAVDIANSRDDILPDFEVVPQYKDDACRGEVALKHFFNFVNANTSTSEMQSPVVVGTVCSTGCQYIGSLVHQHQSIQIAIACNSPRFALRRREYPNLFRTTPTSLSYNAPRAALIGEIGKWRKLVIVTDTNGLNYPDADNFYRYISTFMPNVDVTRFEIAYNVDDELADSLMIRDQQPPRIIFAFLSKQNYVRFACSAYKRGIRGPKYLFVSSLVFVPPPGYPLPPQCPDRNAFEEQLKITVWIGAIFTEAKGVTDLGYGFAEFEGRFNNLSNGTQFPSQDQRFRCHDIMLQALLTLDKSDRRLKSNNRSLLEAMRNDRAVVGQEIRNQALSTEFNGLRGHYRYSKEQGEMDEYFQISQIVDQKLRRGYQCRGNSSGLRSEGDGLRWTTIDGEPPKDAPKRCDVSTDTSEIVFSIMEVIALTLAISEVLACGAIYALTKYFRKRTTSALPLSTLMLISGCILLCPASLVHAFNYADATRKTMQLICHARTALPVFAYGINDAVIVVKLWRLYEMPNMPHLHPGRRYDLYALAACFVFMAFCFGYLSAWFVVSPREAHRVDTYNYRLDEYDTIEHSWHWECSNDTELVWIAGYAVMQAFPLIIAIFLAYNVRNFKRREVFYETTYMRLIAFKQAGLGLITLAAYVCVRTVPYQSILYACLALIDSASTSCILFYNKMQAYCRTMVNRCTQRRRSSVGIAGNENDPNKGNIELPDIAITERTVSQIIPRLTARDDIAKCESILMHSTYTAQHPQQPT